jgi:recombination protein RecR
VRRLHGGEIHEVILALASTVEGEATALYLAKVLRPMGLRLTRIASGMPIGGELEYTDAATISRALEQRREL